MKYLQKSKAGNFSATAQKHDFDGPAGIGNLAYAGELALPYLSAALKSGKTLSNNWIRTLDDVPWKAALDIVTGTGLIGDATCDFSDAGAITLTERTVETKEFQINLDLCKKTMRQSWQAAETGNSLNSRMPTAFTDHVIGHISGLVAQQVEIDIWSGNGGTAGNFTGFTAAAVADPAFAGGSFTTDTAVNDVDLADNLTAVNVVAKIQLVLDSVSSAVMGKEDFALYVSPKTAFLYAQHLGKEGYQNDYQANEKPMNIFGYPILACPGMPDNQIVATYQSNLVFASNILSNMGEVRLMDMSPLDGSDNLRFVMRYSAGTQHAIGGDIWWGVVAA